MGFRNGAYAKVWDVQPKTPNVTTLQISISIKNKETGQYDTKFSEFVSCLGADVAAKAKQLVKGDTIKLGDVDAETTWNAEKRQKYYSWKVFSFEKTDLGNRTPAPSNAAQNRGSQSQVNPAYEGYSDDVAEEGLPF